MSLILSGSDGLSDVDGSAATPAIRGTDANTGIFFPAADVTSIATGGSERMRVTAAGDVGIGTSSPSGRLHVESAGTNYIYTRNSASAGIAGLICQNTGDTRGWRIDGTNFDAYDFSSAATRLRITSGGAFFIGCTATPSATVKGVEITGDIASTFSKSATLSTGDIRHWGFYNPNGLVGGIRTNGSAAAYDTSSDYRLKENIAPLTGALAKVAQLKPSTWTWKVDGSAGQGFIAHELQAVVPDCVGGEKDAVDADGNPIYQGVDTSFLVATLTAAIQELKAELDAAKARIAVLEAK